MTYATLQQLIDRFGEQTLIACTDRGVAAQGEIDIAAVDRALADTDATINSRVGIRYRLPLDPVPTQVTDLAQAIAIYKLHVFAPDPKIKDDYLDAMRTLREIADGVAKLDAAGIEPSSSGASGVQYIDRDRPLSPESMTGFI